MIAGYWILAEFFFFRISSLYQEASMIGLFQEPRKKATVFVAQHSTRVLYVFFVLTLFCNFLRLHRWHCPRITNFVSLRGIKAGNPERARGTHLCRLGNQSEHFAYKNIISFFLRSFYWQNSSLSCSFYSPRISHQEFPMRTYRKTDFRSSDYLQITMGSWHIPQLRPRAPSLPIYFHLV